MAKTDYVYLQGKGKWVRPHQPNQWGAWSMVLYPNPESLEKIRELQAEGIKNVIKKDEDGYNVRFKRPTELKVQGKLVGLRPPEVFDKDGVPLRDVNIGNGSDVTVKLEVYTHKIPNQPGKTAKAARWLSLRVDNLVPFSKSEDFDEDEQHAAEGLDKQPKQEDMF